MGMVLLKQHVRTVSLYVASYLVLSEGQGGHSFRC